MPLKVITIDFWNTLFDSSNGQERNKIRNEAIYRAIAEAELTITEKQIKGAISASWAHFNDKWLNEMRTPLPRESVEFFWDYLKLPNNEYAINQVVDAFASAVLKLPPKLMNNAAYAIKELSKEFKLGIISDTGFSPGYILQEVMKQAGVFDYFSAFSFSDETGVSKPHPKAYHRILGELNIEPDEALHIGDIEKTDIDGAVNLGMKAIRFSRDPNTFAKPNSPHTRANAECFDWNDVIIEIRKLNI